MILLHEDEDKENQLVENDETNMTIYVAEILPRRNVFVFPRSSFLTGAARYFC